MKHLLFALGLVLAASPVRAGDPVVTDVSVEKIGMVWSVHVTIEHPDTGWDHYADGWEVLDTAGNRMGYRELMHPHVSEQPFTRSLNGLVVPDGTREIFVRPRCSEKGWAGEAIRVALSP